MSAAFKNNFSVFPPNSYHMFLNKSSSMKSLPKNFYQGFIMKMSNNSTNQNQSTKSSTPISRTKKPKTRNFCLNLSCTTSTKTNYLLKPYGFTKSKGNSRSTNCSFYSSMGRKKSESNNPYKITNFKKISLIEPKKKKNHRILNSFIEVSEEISQINNFNITHTKKTNNILNSNAVPLSERSVDKCYSSFIKDKNKVLKNKFRKKIEENRNDKGITQKYLNYSLEIPKTIKQEIEIEDIITNNIEQDIKGPEDNHFFMVKTFQNLKQNMISLSKKLKLGDDDVENNYLQYEYKTKYS